ncbi:hypothetical protein FMM68_11175 [Lachnospiraceae bacterium MD329]|nr:hypothetical protein [Lachnospiraceae bacterium MD329]
MAKNVKTAIGISGTGNLDRKQLESMKVADLKQLAADMGVDIAGDAKKENIINALAAVKVDTDAAAMQISETAATAGAKVGQNDNAPAAENQTPTTPATLEITPTVRKRIYVGASVPGYKTSTVFEGEEIPDVLNVDFVRDLCIDVSKVGEFYKKKAVTDSREAFCYRKSVEYANSLKE